MQRTKQGLTIKAGGTTRVSCESRGGNPAAVLKWFIDDEEVHAAFAHMIK